MLNLFVELKVQSETPLVCKPSRGQCLPAAMKPPRDRQRHPTVGNVVGDHSENLWENIQPSLNRKTAFPFFVDLKVTFGFRDFEQS
ncbi:MAG: hypothetical protein AAFY20_06635 [Cyanobacteria bacterium J06639_14]